MPFESDCALGRAVEQIRSFAFGRRQRLPKTFPDGPRLEATQQCPPSSTVKRAQNNLPLFWAYLMSKGVVSKVACNSHLEFIRQKRRGARGAKLWQHATKSTWLTQYIRFDRTPRSSCKSTKRRYFLEIPLRFPLLRPTLHGKAMVFIPFGFRLPNCTRVRMAEREEGEGCCWSAI